MIERHFPDPAAIGAEALLDELPMGRDACAEPFADDSVAFCEAAAALFGRLPAALGPAWAAASFFFRPAALAQMRRELAGLRAPRGLAFHVTPGNVDTQFLYSWLLSLLAGNANVVRISSKLSPETVGVIHDVAALAKAPDFARIRRANRVVSFGHDKGVLDALSGACDVRVLWGGDEAITRLRESPLRPDAKEIAFPDRFSLCVIGAAGFLAQGDTEKKRVARDFVTDVWVFDQMACSSPKAIVWLGDEAAVRAASEALFALVGAELERTGARVALVTAIEKMRFGMGALADGRARRVRRLSNELVVLDADALEPLRSASWGGGLVVCVRASRAADLEALVHASDQTLTYAGLGAADVDALSDVARRRGFCRVVPVGRALAFGRVWDGMDLLGELTRLVVVERREK